MEEEWRPIESWPKFSVSNYGNIRNEQNGKYLKSSFHKRGFVGVNLERDGHRAYVSLARLVGLAFVEGHFNGAEIGYKDRNRENIRADNLEWVNHYQNNRWNSGPRGTVVRQGVVNRETGEVDWEESNDVYVPPRRIRRNGIRRTGVVNQETGEIEWQQ